MKEKENRMKRKRLNGEWLQDKIKMIRLTEK